MTAAGRPGAEKPATRACDEIERSAAKLLALLDAGIESSAMAAERPTSLSSWAAVGQQTTCELSSLAAAQQRQNGRGGITAAGSAGPNAGKEKPVLRKRAGAEPSAEGFGLSQPGTRSG